MTKAKAILLASTVLLAACNQQQASSPTPVPETPTAITDGLLRYQGVVVTKEDLQNLLDAQFSPEQQAALLTDEGKVRQIIGNLFIVRQMAKEARQLGLDDKEAWKIQYQADRILMTALIKHHQDTAPKEDYAKLANEEYLAHPEKYSKPEEVRVEHILISNRERSDDEARSKAETVLTEVKAGKRPFAELAKEFSDDPSVKNNNGDLGFFSKGRMVKSFEDASFALAEKGQVSGLVKTDFGYHIIRLIDRKPSEPIPFEAVKERLVNEVRKNHMTKIQQDLIERVRKLQGIEVDQAAVSALIVRPLSTTPPPQKEQRAAPTENGSGTRQ